MSGTTRSLTTNQLPPFTFLPYCPLSPYPTGGGGYCFGASDCTSTSQNSWWNCTCPAPGDCPKESSSTITFTTTPTPSASATPTAAGGTVAYSLSGISMMGPVDAGGLSVVTTNIAFRCGGHVTPGMAGSTFHIHVSPDYNIYTTGATVPRTIQAVVNNCTRWGLFLAFPLLGRIAVHLLLINFLNLLPFRSRLFPLPAA